MVGFLIFHRIFEFHLRSTYGFRPNPKGKGSRPDLWDPLQHLSWMYTSNRCVITCLHFYELIMIWSNLTILIWFVHFSCAWRSDLLFDYMFSSTFTHAPSTSLQNFRVCLVYRKFSQRMLIGKPKDNHFGHKLIRWNTRIIWPPLLHVIHTTVATSLASYSS